MTFASRIRPGLLATLALVGLAAAPAAAELRLPTILGDGMVLQRDQPVPFWGWDTPGQQVRVLVAGQEQEAVAGADGRWEVTLEALAVGDPLTVRVIGSERITLRDVLVGEVWLCSGQSNMGWPVNKSWNADLIIPAADRPTMRLVTIATRGSQEPLTDFDGAWQACTPDSVAPFSAVGYHFGAELQDRLGVPVGLINNAWGGSPCEAWVRRDHLRENPLYEPLLERWRQLEATYDAEAEEAAFREDYAAWKAAKKRADAAGESAPRRPRWVNPLTYRDRPANLYHGRLGPVMPFGIRGVIWYQGESNASRAFQYREMFPLMIRTWREAWGQGDFPFYWAQLADFKAERNRPRDSDWAELRAAQTQTLDREPNTGQAVIIDLGEASDIHPRNKQEVGRRLARIALANDYGVDVAHASPRFAELTLADGAARVRFRDCGGGLRTVDGKELVGFALAGADRVWRFAGAQIEGADTVVVTSAAVPEPVAVRYAWADNPRCNLYTAEGLPATPFRTDDWPGVTDTAR